MWERSYGYPTNIAANAFVDRDGDGMTDRDEFVAGTNPTNALSRLEILDLSQTSNSTQLTFVAAANRTYTIERLSGTFEGIWERLADVPATKTNRLVSIVDAAAPSIGPTRFYRVVTPRRPD